MNGITFQNASLLPWVAAVAIPILVHLLTRRPLRVYSLPTFRFLARSEAKQSRLFRLQRPLLLAARTLFLLFLVLAFLDPIQLSPLVWTSGARRSIILVLDTSLSMGYSRAGVSSMARVRGQATAILDGLRPGDVCDVVLAGRSPRAILPAPSGDFGALRYAARNVAATSERADVQAALDLAANLLQKTSASRRDLVVLSDFQATNWAGVRAAGIPSDAHVTYVQAASGDRPNAAVTDLTLQPDAPRPGEETTVTTAVWNGAHSAQSLTVTLTTEGDPGIAGAPNAQHATVTVPAFGTSAATFRVGFPAVGIYRIKAATPQDGLPGDDARYLVADLRHRESVLVISDTASSPKSAGYFVRRALNPAPERPGGMLVNVRHGAQLAASDLSACDAAILCDAPSLPDSAAKILAQWVRSGGALIVYLAGPRAAGQMQAFGADKRGGEALPFVPRFPMDIRLTGKGYVTLGDIRTESPLLALFKGADQNGLRNIRFTRFCVASPPAPDAELLMRFSDSTPALARRKVGAGSVLLCNFSPAPEDSDLAANELFLPLTQEFVRGMSEHGEGRTEFEPGAPASVAIDPGQRLEETVVVGPSGARVRTAPESGRGGIVIEDAEEPGFYTVTSAGRQIAVMAVNAPRQESDLRAMDPRGLPTHGENTSAISGGIDGSAALNGTPLWPECLVLAILFGAAEQTILAGGARSRLPQGPTPR